MTHSTLKLETVKDNLKQLDDVCKIINEKRQTNSDMPPDMTLYMHYLNSVSHLLKTKYKTN